MLIAFHKPYGVLSQFNKNPDEPSQRTLAEFDLPSSASPIGRLDLDSEGLLLLSDEPDIAHQLLHPKFRHRRSYTVQVEGTPTEQSLETLRTGLQIRNYQSLPCQAELLTTEPDFPPRYPPVAKKNNTPTTWLRIELREGKNRQVRRMTAAIGHPTLRLVRTSIGNLPLGKLPPGHFETLSSESRQKIFE